MIRSRPSMRMRRGLWSWFGAALMLLALGAGPRLAVGQDADVQALLEQGRTSGADVEQMRAVAERARRADLGASATADLLRPAVALAEQNLPTAPLLSKTLEGLAKRVPPARMQPVLQEYQAHTEQAGQLVAQWTRRSEVRRLLGTTEKDPDAGPEKAERTRLVTAVTEAQQQDVPAKNIEGFLGGLPAGVERRPVSPGQVATAVRVLPTLPENGASLETSKQLLTAALDAGYDPESLRQLPSALQSARRKSNRPVDVLAAGATQAMARGTPAATVLQSLFQGSVPGGGPPAGIGQGPPGNGPGTGKPPDAGPPDNDGPPDDPGPPDDTGPPDGTDPPGNSGGGSS